MRLRRLARRPNAALDGEGARRHGGGWNSAGRAVVYTSTHLSLALLEVLVHFDLPTELLPGDYVAILIHVPDDLAIDRVAFETIDPNRATARARRAVGDAWLEAQPSAVLMVPSVIVPEEDNALINPAHPDAGRIVVEVVTPFAIDRRLLR